MIRKIMMVIVLVALGCDSSEEISESKKNYFTLDGVKYTIEEIFCNKLVGPWLRWGASGIKVDPNTGKTTIPSLYLQFQGSDAPPNEGTYSVVGTHTDIVGDVYIHVDDPYIQITDYFGQNGTVSVTWPDNRPVFKFTNVQLSKGSTGLVSTLTGEFTCP